MARSRILVLLALCASACRSDATGPNAGTGGVGKATNGQTGGQAGERGGGAGTAVSGGGGRSGEGGSTSGAGATGSGGTSGPDSRGQTDASADSHTLDVAPRDGTLDVAPRDGQAETRVMTGATDPGTEGDGDFVEPPPYRYGPDSQRQSGVPQGAITSFDWNNSKIFPGTRRKVHVYVPKQYDGATPAALMVFQDGSEPWAYLNGDYRPAIVLDNLIAKKDIPIVIAVFIDHSDLTEPSKNRSFEYDTVHDLHARFVIEEILPELEKTYKITPDPEGRAAVGESSGGVAAFSMGWFRTEHFHRIMSHSGSFVNLRPPGADTFKDLVKAAAAKPLRIYLNDGANDYMRGPRLNWVAENKALAAALKAKGYHYRFTFGDDGHGGFHGAANFPDSLRWLWRGYPR